MPAHQCHPCAFRLIGSRHLSKLCHLFASWMRICRCPIICAGLCDLREKLRSRSQLACHVGFKLRNHCSILVLIKTPGMERKMRFPPPVDKRIEERRGLLFRQDEADSHCLFHSAWRSHGRIAELQRMVRGRAFCRRYVLFKLAVPCCVGDNPCCRDSPDPLRRSCV